MAKIVIAEGDKNLTNCIQNLLCTQFDVQTAGIARDGYEAIKLTTEIHPEMLLIDMDLPVLNGEKVISSLRLRSSSTLIIAMTNYISEDFVLNAAGNDVRGYILKKNLSTELCNCVQIILSGESYISAEIVNKTFRLFTNIVKKTGLVKAPDPALNNKGISITPIFISRAEFQVAKFIGAGFSNKEIAKTLDIKESTIRNYISLILQKTGLKHRTQIALYAINNGFCAKSGLKGGFVDAPCGSNSYAHPLTGQLKFSFK
ncbi:DNA-binding response regulator [Spirochaetia bacterium]|nr:DNA-binding response regulator [Spirochaetia bacterium]